MDRLLETEHEHEHEHENEQIVLGLLRSVETDGARSQRLIAAELGIALGLVNAYLKRCVKKGLVKVHDVPARRYAYYLTPQGFAEKSRLTVQYLSDSFSFFRKAKSDCTHVFQEAAARGRHRLGSRPVRRWLRLSMLEAKAAASSVSRSLHPIPM
jgi:predicted transcriptional regulator